MTDIETILLILACLAVGFFFGIHTARQRFLELIHNLLGQEAENIEKEDENVINVYVEEKDNIIFVYNAENNDYMAHASNTTDLIENLRKRFPNKQYMASAEDFAKLTGKVKP